MIDGVHFVDGRRLTQWLCDLPSSPVSREAATDLLDKLADFPRVFRRGPALSYLVIRLR